MQREMSQSSSQAPFQPVMLSVPQPAEGDAKIDRLDPADNPRTWSDQMREINQLEDPERWDGLS